MNKQKQLASTWRGPRSTCACGHLGDGSDSDHADIVQGINDGNGHGACRAKGCKCKHFHWKGFTEKFQAALARQKETS